MHWSLDGERHVPIPPPELGTPLARLRRRTGKGWLEHRLRLGVCEGRAELGDLLWLECNAAELNGVSFNKGCFVGQENTARMNWRQKVNRRLVVVETGEPGPRTRVDYPSSASRLNIAESTTSRGDHPDWLKGALAQPSTA